MERKALNREQDSHMAEIAINYKNKIKYAKMPSVGCSSDAVSALRSVWSDRIEHSFSFADEGIL